MKKTIQVFALLMLVTVPPLLVGARTENAPGIQKKTLEIHNVGISITDMVATITWETNIPAEGAVAVLDYLEEVGKIGTSHSVSVPVVRGFPYDFTIVSFSVIFGSATPVHGSFIP